jgi:hypothetical protein
MIMIVLQTCKRPHQGQENEEELGIDEDGKSIVSLLLSLLIPLFVVMMVVVKDP